MRSAIPDQDCHFLSDRPTLSIRTKWSKSDLEDGRMVAQRARSRGLTLGDKVCVQVISQDADELLHEATFVVWKFKTERVEIEDEAIFKTRDRVLLEVQRVGDWLDFSDELEAPPEAEPVVMDVKFIPSLGWTVRLNGEVVVKDIGRDEEAKKRAQRIADGEEAFPGDKAA